MSYDRTRAVHYAALWWRGANPAYRAFEDDCTNFISQCLFAGGLPMEMTGRRDRGWWYTGPYEQWSYSWAVAHSLAQYLEHSGRSVLKQTARELELGDVIAYDWDGDGSWQHTAIVVAADRRGEPLVAAHTVASWQRPWRYLDSPAYTPRTRYLFFHMKGS